MDNDDEGFILQLKVRLETGSSLGDYFRAIVDWGSILVRLSVFMVVAIFIIGVGLLHNLAVWITGGD